MRYSAEHKKRTQAKVIAAAGQVFVRKDLVVRASMR